MSTDKSKKDKKEDKASKKSSIKDQTEKTKEETKKGKDKDKDGKKSDKNSKDKKLIASGSDEKTKNKDDVKNSTIKDKEKGKDNDVKNSTIKKSNDKKEKEEPKSQIKNQQEKDKDKKAKAKAKDKDAKDKDAKDKKDSKDKKDKKEKDKSKDKEAKNKEKSEDTTVKRKNLKKTKSETKVDKVSKLPMSPKGGTIRKKKRVIRPLSPKSKPPKPPKQEKKKVKEAKAKKEILTSKDEKISAKLKGILVELSVWDRYGDVFAEEEIDMDTFVLLTDEDLIGMKVEEEEARKRILYKIYQISKRSGIFGQSSEVSKNPGSIVKKEIIEKPDKQLSTIKEGQDEGGEDVKETKEEEEQRRKKEQDEARVKAIVIYDFVGDEEEFQLSLSAGDYVYIIEKHETGWWWTEAMDGKTGYFPESYLKITKVGERKLEEATKKFQEDNAVSDRTGEDDKKKRKEMRMSLKVDNDPKQKRLGKLAGGTLGRQDLRMSEAFAHTVPAQSTTAPTTTAGPPNKAGGGNGLMSLTGAKRASMRVARPEESLNVRRNAQDVFEQ